MMKKIIRFLCLLIIVLASVGVAGCQRQENSWQTIKSRGTLVIGVDDSFVPMDFRQKNGKLVGFDVFIIFLLAQLLRFYQQQLFQTGDHE